MKINCNIAHKNGHHGRNEACRISKEKGSVLTGYWKPCLLCTHSKEKQRYLSSDSDHEVTENPGKRMLCDATIAKKTKYLKATIGRYIQQLMVDEATQNKFSNF